MTKLFNKKNLTIFAFTSPWVIGFLSFGIYPIIISFYYSLCQYDVLREPMFIGLENYRTILYEDAYFGRPYGIHFIIQFLEYLLTSFYLC